MSLKDLFESTKVTKSGSADETAYEVESDAYTDAFVQDKNEYVPPVDFSTASNFARYGSAAKYYEDSIQRIYNSYPYDGSKYEVLDFHNSSSFLDRWMLEYKYPRSTGYIHLGTTSGSGDWLSMVSESSGVGGYGMPDTTSNNILEYIEIKGGPNTGSADRTFETQDVQLKKLFDFSNVYDSGSAREYNLEYDLRTGMTVEFWMLKNSFYTSKTEREVVFDLWNNENSSSAGYGRLMIELSGGSDAGSSIRLTAQSGTSGFVNEPLATLTPSEVADGVWKHYAITLKNHANNDGITAKLYVNGQVSGSAKLGSTGLGRVTGSMMANIGALIAPPSGATGFYDSTTIAKGGAKLSASLDEFRFWKLERDPRQIGRYWFTQVGGGTNTDKANVGLGVYYKFNEGIMNSGSRDRTVLDYSGRISNGFWKGGVAECRNSGSAMASGSHNMNEFHDPIIYSEHPDVEDLEIAMVASGTLHDNLNNSLITSNFPDWIDTESRTTTLKHFTQIFASYFDKLHMQIEGLGKLKDRYGSSYSSGDVSASFKPVPFAKNLVTQFGIAVPEILQEAELIENFLNRNEVEEYEEKLYNIRNQIYSNIYANLLYVFKTKGTEKSMRNMLRCFGIDDELVKINAYADNSDYVFKDNRRATSNKTNYVSFNHSDRIAGTVYQAVSMSVDGVYSNPNARAYITGSSGFGEYNAQTIECEVFFPLKTEDILSKQWYPDTFVTASMFGAMGTVESQTDTRFPTGRPVDLKVLVIKDKLESKRAKFMLQSKNLGTLTTDYYEDVYDDTRWNFAVRVKPTKHPWIDHISGSDGALGDQTFDVEFYGVNVFTDVVQHEFLKTTTVTEAVGKTFLSSSKRCYVGALHTDFTGSTTYYSNVEVGNLRYWFSDVSDDVVLTHAMDQSSFGVESPYKNAFIYQTSMSGNYVPQIATLALHWNFDNVTGSGPSPTTTENTKDAQFIVQDISSGSAEHGERYEPAFSDQVMMQHLGIGDFFLENKKDIVNTRYIPTAKVVLPEYLHSSDMVEIRQNDDEFFTMDTRPSKVYYSIEKSMYQTISEEMVKMFSSIKDFDNLIGEPVNRYRPKYKDLGKLRQLFFEKMPNSPDLDKYVDYYKWIDSAVSRFLEDLFPASAEHSEGMQTMVESHMLERNKYETKFPSMEMADDPPAASFDTINTLLYDYQRGHAPVPLAPGGAEMMDQDDNCLWWSKRAEREHPILASTALSASSPGMNLSGTLTSRIAIFSASTSAFNRKLHTPYKYSVDQTRIIHGGINYDDNKKLDYVYPATVPFSPRGVDYGKFGGYPLGYLVAKDMDTDASPSASLPQCDMPRSASYGAKVKREGYRVMDGWEGFKSQAGNQAYVAPIAASGTVTVTNSADLYDIGNHKVLLQLTTTDGTVVSVYQAGAKDLTDANNPIIERIVASLNTDSWREAYAYRIYEALNNNSKLTAVMTGEIGGAFPFVTVTQAEAGISGNRSIILTGSVPASSTTFETNGLESTPLQGGQEGVTPTPSWGSGSYIHFRGNLVMPFNVISSSADDVNEGYTKLINQDLTVWGGGTGVGHSTDAGTYINKRSHAYGLHESRTGDDDDGSATATELGGLGRGVNLVNLHTDTYGEDKETPMQGPFTEKYVGGRKYRHAAINDGTDTLKNRMEGWLVLINTALSTSSGVLHATSGGVGLTGPDYPFPHGPYPFQADDGGGGNSIHWRPIGGRYYRDEVAKRPVNIRNIQMVTSSAKTAVIGEHRVDVIASDGDDESSWTKHYHEQIATGSAITVLGNYRHNYEVVHTVGRSNQKPFLRDNQSVRNISQTGSAYEIGSNPAVGGRWQLIDGVVDGEIDYGAWYAPDDTDLTKLGQVSSSVRTGADSGARPIDLLATTHVETILTMPQRFWTDKDQDGNLLLHDLQDKINHASFDYSQTGAQQIHFKIIPKLRRTDFGDGEDQHAFIYTNFQVQSRESGSTNLNTIIANRFSAPGGPRNQSKGFLDLAAEEYSVYNAYPWRNLEVLGSSSGEYLSTKAEIHSSSHHPRLGLRSLRAMPSGRFGVENVVGQDTEIQDHSHDYGVSPSWHKVHRNGRLEHRIATALNGGDNDAAFGRTIAISNYYTHAPSNNDTVIIQMDEPRTITLHNYYSHAPADGETVILTQADGTNKYYKWITKTTSPAHDSNDLTKAGTESDPYLIGIETTGAVQNQSFANMTSLGAAIKQTTDFIVSDTYNTYNNYMHVFDVVYPVAGAGPNAFDYSVEAQSSAARGTFFQGASFDTSRIYTDPTYLLKAKKWGAKKYFKFVTATSTNAWDDIDLTENGIDGDEVIIGIHTTASVQLNSKANMEALRYAIESSTALTASYWSGAGNYVQYVGISYPLVYEYEHGQKVTVMNSSNAIDYSNESDGVTNGTFFADTNTGISSAGTTPDLRTGGVRFGHSGDEYTQAIEKRIYDNDYVTRPIPQNEYQYAWISASLAPSGANSTYYNLGHGYNIQGLNHPTPSGSRPVDPILFISASDAGSSIAGSSTHETSADQGFRYFGIAKGLGTEHIPNVHRLNLNIREDQNNWLTDGSGAVALGFYASGGILPADDPLPIGHNTGESRGGFAYASRIANLHNYVNSAIQFGKGLRVLSNDASGDAIMQTSTAPNEDPLYLQGAFVQDDDGTGLWQNEPIRWDILPQYWSGSSGYWNSVSLTGPNYTDSTDYHEEYAIRQSVGSIFNSLMWKRNGPYGYPTWKQIRGGEHILAQTMRKNNRYVVVDPRSDRVVPPLPGFVGRVRSLRRMQGSDAVAAFRKLGHINTAERKHHHYYVPVAETNAKTMLAAIHRGALTATWSSTQMAQGLDLLSPGGIMPSNAPSVSYSIDPDKMLYANVTHVNNLKNFPNSQLNEDVGLRNFKTDRTAYNDLYEMYTEMTDLDGNDAYTLVDLTYRETVYPKSKNAGRSDIRQRSNFDVGFWAADADAEYQGKTNETDLYGYHEPVGRRTFFIDPDVSNAHGQWEFHRGDTAPNRSMYYSKNSSGWYANSVFNTRQGWGPTSARISSYHRENNLNVMHFSASIWPMDGGKSISSFSEEYAGNIGPRQFLASSSHDSSNPGYAEGFYFDGLIARINTHGAPGILQNQFTWFHNGMSIGIEPTTISSSNSGDYNQAGTRNAVVSSSTLSNSDFYAAALKAGMIREDTLGKHILTERVVFQAAAGMAFAPAYSRPHMLVGRDSYCSPSAGRAAYSRRFLFTGDTTSGAGYLSGSHSFGKGAGVSPFLTDIKPRGGGVGTGTTVPFSASQRLPGGQPSVVLDMGDRVCSQMTRSIGHDVEGLYVSDWEWKAPLQSGKAPFYANYSKWFEELRGKSQDRQVLPEYRISDRIPYFVLDKQGRFTSRDREWLSIHGNPSSSVGHLTSSADFNNIGNRITSSFMSDYAVTAAPALLDAIKTENAGIAEPYELTLTCDAVVKFLPYQGFYPQLRTVDLCKQFVESYDEHVSFESDLGINDLVSAFVRVDSSGSINSSGGDRYGWSPFGPGGGIIGNDANGTVATAVVQFRTSLHAESTRKIDHGDEIVIEDGGKRIKLIYDRTSTLNHFGSDPYGTDENESREGAANNNTGVTSGGDIVGPAWEPLGAQDSGGSATGSPVYANGDFNQVYKWRGLRAGYSSYASLYDSQTFGYVLNHARHNGHIDVSTAGYENVYDDYWRTSVTLKYDNGTPFGVDGANGWSDIGTGGTAGNSVVIKLKDSTVQLDNNEPAPWLAIAGFGTVIEGVDPVTANSLSNAQFFSEDVWSGYSFNTDEILDTTLARVGGSNRTSKTGMETHGRNPAAAKRPFYGPFMAPGILFNTIKSGIAVDYPVLHRKLATTASVDRDGGRNYQILNEYFDNRLPFETLVQPEKYLTNVPLIDMEPHPSASINVTASWNGQGDPLYKMMMHNFLAEIPNFYLADQSMQSFVSLPESDGGFGQVEAVVHNGEQVIPEYRMMVKVWKSQENTIRPQTPSASNHWQNHRGPLLGLKTKAHDGSHSGSLVYNGVYEPCYYTDVIGMESLGKNKEGAYSKGWYVSNYQSPQGVKYSRKEVSYPRPQSDAPETITMYSRPSAFGPACAGGFAFQPELEYIYTGSAAPMSMSYDPDGYSAGSVGPVVKPENSEGEFIGGHVAGSGSVGKVADRIGTTFGMKDGTNGFNAPFTPPYYDGQAWAFLTFKPSRTGKHYLDDIWENTTINFLRYEFDYISGAYGDWGTVGPQGYAINVNAMHVDAAVNIKGKTSIKEVTYDAVTGLPQTVQDSLQNTARNSAWVIQTKFETPILHFGHGITDNQDSLVLSGSTSASCMVESNGYHHGYPGLCEPIGMWHQYGEIPSASQGIYLEVCDIPPEYLRYGTEMTIANPKWLHITGSPDPTVGSSAGVVRYLSGSVQENKIEMMGAPDWDGWTGSGSFYECLVVQDTDGGDGSHTANSNDTNDKFLMGQGYRFSGSLSGSELAYVVGADTIAHPDLVDSATLTRGGRQQYMRWRLMSTGSLAGIIADRTHLQLISADDGTILDTTWGVPLTRTSQAAPGISGSGPCFERGFYIDASVTGSNIISGSAHAGGLDIGQSETDIGAILPAHDDAMTHLNRGYPGTSSMRQELMGIGKLKSIFTSHNGVEVVIPYRNYYTQWKFDVPNNANVDKQNLAVSYQSPLHRNKRGVIPDPPHFSNNVSSGSFGDALGATYYSHATNPDNPTTMANVGYAVADFAATGTFAHVSAGSQHRGGIVGCRIPANSFSYRFPVSNSVGVGRAEIICGYTGSTGRYGYTADGTARPNRIAGELEPEYDEWAKVIDGPLSGTAPRYVNSNRMMSGFTHGETSYQRFASDYYGAAAGSGSTTTIGVPQGVNGFHGRTGGSGDSAAGWYGDGLEDIYPLGQRGYPHADAGKNGLTHNHVNGVQQQDMLWIPPILSWYTNPVHMANVRMQDMFHRDEMMSANQAKQHKVEQNFVNMKAALGSPRTVPSGKFLPRGGVQALTKSLADLCGFESGAKKLGQVSEFKKVKEAVVVVPYVMGGPNNSRRRFVPIDTQQVDRYFGRGEFTNTAYWASLEKMRNLEGTAISPVSGLQVNLGSSVMRQIRLMDDYVFPPHLDFVNNETAKPYAMYIFEYEHTFSAQDLADMWQGLYPDSGKIMKQATKQVTHKLNIVELLGGAQDSGGELPDQIRFMVFKVKQRAAINYFAQTKNQLDDQRFRFKFKAGSKAQSTDYSYNWPYDFFSLVETAKIDMSVTLRNKKLIEDIELQELNQRATIDLGSRTSSAVDLSRRVPSSMTIISISESTVRTAARNATTSMATAAISATYGTPSPAAGVAPSSGPTLSGPTRGGY